MDKALTSVPVECEALHNLYKSCYDAWAGKKVLDRQLIGGLEQCNPAFDDYRLCYVEGVKERLKQKRESGSSSIGPAAK